MINMHLHAQKYSLRKQIHAISILSKGNQTHEKIIINNECETFKDVNQYFSNGHTSR